MWNTGEASALRAVAAAAPQGSTRGCTASHLFKAICAKRRWLVPAYEACATDAHRSDAQQPEDSTAVFCSPGSGCRIQLSDGFFHLASLCEKIGVRGTVLPACESKNFVDPMYRLWPGARTIVQTGSGLKAGPATTVYDRWLCVLFRFAQLSLVVINCRQLSCTIICLSPAQHA